MEALQVVYRPPESLTPYPQNARTHSPGQIRQLMASIRQFGFTNPVLIDGERTVIAGHGRVLAAQQLKLVQIPTIQLADLSPAQVRAYRMADNQLATQAGWDRELLALGFQGLAELDLDFDLEITGFAAPEIDLLLQDVHLGDPAPPDDTVPALDPGPAVTQPGDLWTAGPHRLLCADARDPASYRRLLGDDRAQLVFTDPPYNVPIAGHVSGNGRAQHGEFAMACGELSAADFTAFLQSTLTVLADFSQPGALHYVCMDWRHLSELLSAGKAVYSDLKNLCVWAKTNAGLGSLYRSQHELVLVFKVGTAPHINNVELGRHGRHRSNVWHYAGVNTFRAERDTELAWHPTVKPLALVADAILDASHRGGVVLDAFTGSGTTLLAAEQTGRHGAGIELEPAYCDVALRRLIEAGHEPVLAASGETFSERDAARAAVDTAANTAEVRHGGP